MKFNLIICTYNRPEAIIKLLDSVKSQKLYPDEILIIDGSYDGKTKEKLNSRTYQKLQYFKVEDFHRGLTRQRNFGIERTGKDIEIICFLDDDVVLKNDYFKNLLKTYIDFPNALGVGGYIIDEVKWRKLDPLDEPLSSDFVFDGYARKDSSRFLLRKKLNLINNEIPTYMPPSAHGRSVGFLPPNGKIYPVETFMGGVSSYRKGVFDEIKFSTYFEGYGLYEDTDFTLRLSKMGSLYLNTSAQLFHYHNDKGRPNQFKYGKMVVRNGWYVWRVKYPNPTFTAKIKWNLNTLVLLVIRISNIFSTSKRKLAFTESLGRIFGWTSLIFNKPKINK